MSASKPRPTVGHLASIGLGKRGDHFVTLTADVPQCDRAHVLSVQAWSSFWDVRKYVGRKWDKCKVSGIPHAGTPWARQRRVGNNPCHRGVEPDELNFTEPRLDNTSTAPQG